MALGKGNNVVEAITMTTLNIVLILSQETRQSHSNTIVQGAKVNDYQAIVICIAYSVLFTDGNREVSRWRTGGESQELIFRR